MILRKSTKRRGAPLQILILIIVFWPLFRIAWNEWTEYQAITGVEVRAGSFEFTQDADPVQKRQRFQRSSLPPPGIMENFNFSEATPADPQVGLDRKPPMDVKPAAKTRPKPKPKIGSKPESSSKPSSMPNQAIGRYPAYLQSQKGDGDILSPAKPKTDQKRSKRWSLYSWAFLRANGTSDIASPFAQYGGNQAGAILTYRFLGNRDRNVSAYVRTTSELSSNGQERLAAGLVSKPLKNLPISLHSEVRYDLGTENSVSAALFVSGGTGPDRIGSVIDLESYAQAGLALNGDSIGFFDASAILSRPIWQKDETKLSLGLGVWAGGQEGAARLDVGPRIDLRLPVSRKSIRMSVDWRQRVAGNAVPDSGLAFTISGDF